MSKHTKEAVNYRDGTKARHCSICRHWIAATTSKNYARCTKVEGEIKAAKDCDIYAARA